MYLRFLTALILASSAWQWEPNMKAELCIQTLENALTAYPELEGAVIHSDRGTQYTSESYRQTIREHHIHQSMNSAGGRCNDNARCESMWARMKTELLYDRYDTRQMTAEELKVPHLEILPQLLE